MALPLCNSGRLLSVRHCLVSLLCRCIVQRLSVTDFMHPCIPTLFDHLYASLHRAFGHTRPASVPGLNVGLPPSPSKDACSQSHTVAVQGRIMTATRSRYAWTHKDSRTKPLHDATAQMAVDAQMQRHKQLTLQRCKTSRASNAKHPFLKIM